MEKSNKKEAFQLGMMIFLTCLSQVIALYKSSYLATRFGASVQMDAYNFSTNIASFLFLFITSGITTVVIPAYVKKESRKVIDTFITVTYGAVLLLSILLLLTKMSVVSFLTNRGAEFQNDVTNYLLFVFLIQGLLAFQGVTNAYYQVNNRYLIPKYTLLISNIIVAMALFLSNMKNIKLYLFILLAGSLINVLFDLSLAFKAGFRYSPSLSLKDVKVKKLFLIFFPTLISSGIYKVQTFVDSFIAANLTTGMLTILTFSNQVLVMVNNLLIGNLTVYAYPKIVEKLGTKNEKRFFWDYTILFHAFICLIFVGFYSAGEPFLKMVFEGGKFGREQTSLLFICILVSIFGQQFNIIRDLIYRYFYANGNTKSTLNNSVIVSLTNIVISLILAQFYGVIGILLGTTIASFFSLVMIMFRFERIYQIGISLLYLIKEYVKNEVALGITLFVVFMLKSNLNISQPLFSFGIYGLLSIVIFFLSLKIMKSNVFKTRLG